MECPNCGSRESTVKDSRSLKTTIRRRRQCPTCHHRWTTIEAAIDDTASTTQQEMAAKLAKIQDLSEQISNLKIQNNILRVESRAYSQPSVTHYYDAHPHLLFVLGTGSGPPYRIGVTRNADKIRSQYSKPTESGLKILYQKRQDRAVYARTTKQQVYDHFREKGIIGEWIKAPLAGFGKSRDFEKMAMERARYRNEGHIRSMAYGRAPGDEWQRNDDQSTFSASC